MVCFLSMEVRNDYHKKYNAFSDEQALVQHRGQRWVAAIKENSIPLLFTQSLFLQLKFRDSSRSIPFSKKQIPCTFCV